METISIGELEVARALAKTGSLAAAARELHRTPAAVHKQLKRLEATLGVALYEKVGRNVEISGAMEAFFPHAESALMQVAAARRAVEEWRGLRSGIVRIGTGPTLSAHFLPGIVTAFRGRYPDVQVTIDTATTAELMEQMRRGQLDLAIVLQEEQDRPSDLVTLGSWESTTVVATATKRLWRAKRLADFEREPFFSFRVGTRMAAYVDTYFARHQHRPNTVMRCDNADAIRAMLRSGFGYSVLPAWTLREEKGPKRIAAVPVAEKLRPLRIEIVASRNHPLSPASKAFAEAARGFRLP
jgi:LysR family transcriptional regulator, transcription activator of glutamate synthase operon